MLVRTLKWISRGLPALLVGAALLTVAKEGSAVPVVWSVNGHSYSYVPVVSPVTWTEASRQAEALVLSDGSVGYLATITSAEEQAFIQSNVLPPTYVGVNKNQVWIGGKQDPGQAPTAGWKWIVNPEIEPEGWDYDNWTANEPNDDGSIDERFLTMWVHYYNAGKDLRGSWNDSPDTANVAALIIGFIVEHSPPGVPEPATAALAALGLGLLALRRRSR